MQDQNTSNQVTVEQRRFPRVSTSCRVNVHPIEAAPGFDDPENSTGGIMKNISGGGIAFTSDQHLDESQMLAMEVALPGFPTDVIAYGKVCWCNPSDELDAGFDVGVEFWWIGWNDDAAQNQIRSFITSALGDDSSS